MNSKKEESEGDISLEEFFKKQLSPCFEETKRQRNLDELVGHCRYSNSLLDILSKMSKEMPMGKLSNSFIYMRLFELIKQLTIWDLHICCGAYHNAIRDMRYSIEAILKAYYIDTRHPDSNLECKLEILKEIDYLHGNKLIKNIEIEFKDEMKEVYKELCQYVHPSSTEFEADFRKDKNKSSLIVDKWCSRASFTFDEELFDGCMRLRRDILTICVFVAMSCLNGEVPTKTLSKLVEEIGSGTLEVDV